MFKWCCDNSEDQYANTGTNGTVYPSYVFVTAMVSKTTGKISGSKAVFETEKDAKEYCDNFNAVNTGDIETRYSNQKFEPPSSEEGAGWFPSYTYPMFYQDLKSKKYYFHLCYEWSKDAAAEMQKYNSADYNFYYSNSRFYYSGTQPVLQDCDHIINTSTHFKTIEHIHRPKVTTLFQCK